MSITKTLPWVVKETERKEENWILMWWGSDSPRKKIKGKGQMPEKRRGGEGGNCLREVLGKRA